MYDNMDGDNYQNEGNEENEDNDENNIYMDNENHDSIF